MQKKLKADAIGKTNQKVIFYLVCGIPLIYQIVLSSNLTSYLLYIPYVIITLMYIFLKNKFNVNKKIVHFSIIFFIAYFCFPFLFFSVGKAEGLNGVLYLLLYAIFILSLVRITIMIDKDNYVKLIRGMLVMNSPLLVYLILSNVIEINLQTVSSIFTGIRAHRASFNFGHPNTAAMFIITEIILIYINYFNLKKYKKYTIVSILILLIPLFATGSRTSLIALITFFLGEIYLNLSHHKVIKILINIVLAVGISLLFYQNIDFSNFLSMTSGRDKSFNYNLAYLIETNNLFIGLGPSPISSLVTTNPFIKISDNWYMTHLLSFGLISLILILFNIIMILRSVIKFNRKKNSYVINMLVLLLIYSVAENVLFVPGTILTAVLWIIIYCNIKVNYEIEGSSYESTNNR